MSKMEYMPVDCLQVPKMLFQVEEFKNLSNTAKILYSLFLDRLKFAVQNGWVDHNGDLFVIYPKSEMKKDLNTTRYGVDQAVQELVKIGKLVRIVQNDGKANHFYINDIYENEMEEESMMTLDRIMANMQMEEREIIMDKMVAASRDILGTIADMGYLNEYETPLTPMIIGGVYNFSKAAAIDYVEEIKSYKAGIPMACVRNGKILPAQKRSPLNLPTRISKLSILPYVTEEIQEIIQGKYMLNIDSYTAAPVSLFSIVNKAHCQKKDLVNALMGQKNSNQKAFIWVRQNKGNDSRCIYFEGKNPSVLTGEILAITANAIFEMPRKDGIYTMASYLEKYQVLDELKKIDKFKSEGKI